MSNREPMSVAVCLFHLKDCGHEPPLFCPELPITTPKFEDDDIDERAAYVWVNFLN